MKLDDFESVFRSAVKERFHFAAPAPASALLITDLPEQPASALAAKVKGFLAHVGDGALAWQCVGQGEYQRVGELLALVERHAPDIMVSYRHLLGREHDLLHSLGSFIDSLAQMASQPILLLPPLEHADFEQRLGKLENVLIITDHIVGDDRLVQWGVHLCPPGGVMVMAHVEDDTTFQRYAELLAMIPDAPTEIIVARLRNKLLGRPADYMQSVADALAAQGCTQTVVPVVTMGHALSDYKRIMDEHDIDLVVMNTKDDKQLAMHGMAYAISVEIQDRPLLLL